MLWATVEECYLKRRPVLMVFLVGLATAWLYLLWWFYATKEEANEGGADIPSFLWALVPIVNFWWLWRFARGMETVSRSRLSAVVVFALIFLGGLFGILVVQHELNQVPRRSRIPQARVVA